MGSALREKPKQLFELDSPLIVAIIPGIFSVCAPPPPLRYPPPSYSARAIT